MTVKESWMLFVFILLSLPDDDLRELKIPANAVEQGAAFRRWAFITTKKAYRVGSEIVGERLFYEDGKLADERLYRNKKLHGIWRQYHRNGRLFSERPYRDGQLDGTFRFWDENGKLLGESQINKGTGVLREYKNDAVECFDKETPYVNGKVHGFTRLWGKFNGCRGIGSNVSFYKEGVMDGYSYFYDEDGTVLGWAYVWAGKLHGFAQHTDRNGKSLDGYPLYRINGEQVTEAEFRKAATSDKLLQETLTHQPPKLEEFARPDAAKGPKP
ncbi:MAG: hypothetical protein HY290_17020 [Planctomycetia bacterium]|nr:hypothetical protein [Planctomycetia bacterium]